MNFWPAVNYIIYGGKVMAIQWTVNDRPTSFKQMYGCDQLKKYVKECVNNKEWPTTLLFDGGTGSGKTTSAYIIAAMMNCKNPDSEGNPCCECDSCKSIFSGAFNRDTKSFTVGTSNATEILAEISDQIKMPPFRDKESVIIVNEVQNMRADGQKKFLELLETPTPNVHFILTTMEGVKDRAISGRSVVFKFRFATVQDITNALIDILEKKDLLSKWQVFDPTAEVLNAVAMSAYGSYRTAIQNMQTVLETDPQTQKDALLCVPGSEAVFAYDAIQAIFSKTMNKQKVFEKAIDTPDYTYQFNLMAKAMEAARVYKIFGQVPDEMSWLESRIKDMAGSNMMDEAYNVLCNVLRNPYTSAISKEQYFKFVCDLVELNQRLNKPMTR